MNQGWHLVPEVSSTPPGTYADRPLPDAGLPIANPIDAGPVHNDAEHAPFDRAATTPHADHDETIDVALRDEELRAGTRQVERGRAQVEKVVTEDQQTIDVPVTEERLTVTRRAATAADVDVDATLEEGTIDIPLRGEEVVVDKQANVREVVEIGKEAVTHTERVSDTVRSEDVRVREGDSDVVEDNTGDGGTRRGNR